MAGISVEDAELKGLQEKATKLVSAIESLTVLFDQEETRLKRKDEVTRLKLFGSTTLQQTEREKSTELSARMGYNQGKLFVQGAGLLMAGLSKNNKVQSFARSLLTEAVGTKPSFGTVRIRIDDKGLPNGVEVVCISRLGRELNQSEPEIINRLKKDGSLLFSEENFSRLIDKLVEGILKGQLTLPVSIQTLSKM